GGDVRREDDDRPQWTVAADRARSVAVGDSPRPGRCEQRQQQEPERPPAPAHAANEPRSLARGSSIRASEPRSERRRAKRPSWAAATCLTTARPWPRRRRPERRAITSAGVSRRAAE